MGFKFEKLEVWQTSLDYADLVYGLADKLPESERFNLRSQIIRAATSVSLNIAEGSTSQSDAEQDRFLRYAIRSLIETVGCQHLIHRRDYLQGSDLLARSYRMARTLFKRLQAMRRSLRHGNTAQESTIEYEAREPAEEPTPFEHDQDPSSPVSRLRSPVPGTPVPGPPSPVQETP